MPIPLGGHRGLGCTDHAFYASRRDIACLPVENSLESFQAAYEAGAAYVELDAVVLADEEVVCLHNVVPSDHFFGPRRPERTLDQLTFAQLQGFFPGHGSTQGLTTLADALELAHRKAPGTTAWKVNIELKGVQGSGQANDIERLVAAVDRCLQRTSLPIEHVLFSSFCLESLVQMVRRRPRAHYGMLFNETAQVLPIYADHQDELAYQYLPFTASHIDAVLQRFGEVARPLGARMDYLHPEFESCTPALLEQVRRRGLGLNLWSYMEAMDPVRLAGHAELARAARAHQVPYTVITDYLDSMRSLDI